MNIKEFKQLEVDEWLHNILATMSDDIIEQVQKLKFNKNDIIINPDDPATSVYIVLKGSVKVQNILPTGAIYSFASLHAPFFLGEDEAFADITHYRGSVECETRCTALHLSRDLFLMWMKSNTECLFNVSSYIIQKHISQKIKDRSYLFFSGSARVAYCLSEHYVLQQKNDLCKLKITRVHLADEVGLSVKTVNRCIDKLKTNNALSVEGRYILIDKMQYCNLIDIINK